MGEYFGISDLPVSTPMTPFEYISVPEDPRKRELEEAIQNAKKVGEKPDAAILSNTAKKTKSIIGMRFGFGKLMQSFSKKIIK